MSNLYDSYIKRYKRDEGVDLNYLRFSQTEKISYRNDKDYLEGCLICIGKFIKIGIWEYFEGNKIFY